MNSVRGRDPDATVGVTIAVRLGEYTLTNVPTRFEQQPSPLRAVIGLDLLGRLAPTFDALTGTMTLRRSGQVNTDGWGFHIPTLITETGLNVVKTTTIFPIGHPDIQRYLRNARWTLNPWRGEIVVE